MKECWILSDAFSVSIEMIIWSLLLFFFWNTVYWLMILMLNQSCIPGMNHTQLLCFILLSIADFQLLGYY